MVLSHLAVMLMLLAAAAALMVPAATALMVPAATALDPAATALDPAGTAPGHTFTDRHYSVGVGVEVRVFVVSEFTIIPAVGLNSITLFIYRATIAAGYEVLPTAGSYGVSYPSLVPSDVSATQSDRAAIVGASSFSAGSSELGQGWLVIRPILKMLEQNNSFVLRVVPYAVFKIKSETPVGYVIHQPTGKEEDEHTFEDVVRFVEQGITLSSRNVQIFVARMKWPEDRVMRDLLQDLHMPASSYFPPDGDAAIKIRRVPDSPPYSFQIRLPNQLQAAPRAGTLMTCAAGGVITVVANMVKGYAQNQLSQPILFGNWRLALTWGPGFCRGGPWGSSPCSKPIQPRFTVHGLWAYDMTSQIIVGIGKQALDMIVFKLLRPYLEREWPSLIGPHDHERFWTYEWHKHAQMLNLPPSEYFLKALQYKWTVDFLTNGGLEVFLGYPRTEATLVLCQQIERLVKAIPVVICSKVHKGLLEVQFCFDHVSDTFINCANNILQCVHSSCGSNVVIGS